MTQQLRKRHSCGCLGGVEYEMSRVDPSRGLIQRVASQCAIWTNISHTFRHKMGEIERLWACPGAMTLIVNHNHNRVQSCVKILQYRQEKIGQRTEPLLTRDEIITRRHLLHWREHQKPCVIHNVTHNVNFSSVNQKSVVSPPNIGKCVVQFVHTFVYHQLLSEIVYFSDVFYAVRFFTTRIFYDL